jgi:hypothetical protein
MAIEYFPLPNQAIAIARAAAKRREPGIHLQLPGEPLTAHRPNAIAGYLSSSG